MKKSSILLICVLSASLLFAQKNEPKVIKRIDQLIEKELRKSTIHNAYLSVYSPSKNFEWHTAKGEFKDGSEVTLENPFYTASIGKTFTATAIGMLVDQGELGFEDPISKYLPQEMIEGLHVLNGTDYGDEILIRHLLQHTSGLPDYFGRETADGSPGVLDLVLAEPDHFWEPEELITYAKDHYKPFFPPGTDYEYTDTEYVLLGLIVEKAGGKPLHEFFQMLIFEPLAMNHTYLNRRSAALNPTPKMAEMYADEYEVSSFTSLSADWAGGAIVSTGKDLITFLMALRNEQLVSAATWKAMQQWTDETKGMDYGFGLRKISFRELSAALPRWQAIGHSGLNGTSMYYCPELDIYIAGTLNQLSASKEAVVLMAKVLMMCKKL